MWQTNEFEKIATIPVKHCERPANVMTKAKRYGKYTVQSTFAGSCSITDVMNCYIERKASLRYQ